MSLTVDGSELITKGETKRLQLATTTCYEIAVQSVYVHV